MTERVDVGMNVVEWDVPSLGALLEQLRIMDTLRTRQDFLATKEEIITIGELGVLFERQSENNKSHNEQSCLPFQFQTYLWIGHCIERTNCQRIFIHEEKVRVILCTHNVTELLFVLRAQILKVVLQNKLQMRKLTSTR